MKIPNEKLQSTDAKTSTTPCSLTIVACVASNEISEIGKCENTLKLVINYITKICELCEYVMKNLYLRDHGPENASPIFAEYIYFFSYRHGEEMD